MELNRRNSDQGQTQDLPGDSIFQNLSQIRHDLQDVIDALALLGIKRCSECNKFFRCSDPGALFDCGKIVCYGCVPGWWSKISEQLRVEERETLETRLSSWLRKHHGAEIVKQETGKISERNPLQFQIVVRCRECLGSGKLLEGERCRFCNGFGTVRVVVPG